MQTNTPPQPSMQPVDYTTPVVVFSATLLAIALIAAIILVPGAIADKLMPILLILLSVVVGAFGTILNKKLTDTHTLVNSQMTAFRDEMVVAKQVAFETSEARLTAATDAANAAGHARGLETGRAEAMTALSAIAPVAAPPPPSSPPVPTPVIIVADAPVPVVVVPETAVEKEGKKPQHD